MIFSIIASKSLGFEAALFAVQCVILHELLEEFFADHVLAFKCARRDNPFSTFSRIALSFSITAIEEVKGFIVMNQIY